MIEERKQLNCYIVGAGMRLETVRANMSDLPLEEEAGGDWLSPLRWSEAMERYHSLLCPEHRPDDNWKTAELGLIAAGAAVLSSEWAERVCGNEGLRERLWAACGDGGRGLDRGYPIKHLSYFVGSAVALRLLWPKFSLDSVGHRLVQQLPNWASHPDHCLVGPVSAEAILSAGRPTLSAGSPPQTGGLLLETSLHELDLMAAGAARPRRSVSNAKRLLGEWAQGRAAEGIALIVGTAARMKILSAPTFPDFGTGPYVPETSDFVGPTRPQPLQLKFQR